MKRSLEFRVARMQSGIVHPQRRRSPGLHPGYQLRDHAIGIVPGATRLFEEPGTLDAAIALTRDWLGKRLPAPLKGLCLAGAALMN
jgi:hypothetical protein